ncbi:plasmid stabilization system [Scytonema hofmannii PCC 7110]|uniref:Plasmid stabilization system n=1 Tax=Scytonema hofmannii PCC 7110 TaxID=128403 RepID=A0A139WZG3_9CYAN|nr:type II toxin-antitoxin system RelE/ParE family toxin [Scytonema hofmannii]KYC37839.1 plasmid stabilization system [Scytonema hofmannii PCC 7110]
MSNYTVYIQPETFSDIKNLPGNIKQRVRKAIQGLADNPRPPDSKRLDLPEFEAEVWRLRLDNWRIVYAITEENSIVDVLAVRKRPPYDYGDLETLLSDLKLF